MNSKSLPITCATCRRRPTCLIATWRSCWPPATPWPCKRRRKVRYAYRRINTEEGSPRTIIWIIGLIHALFQIILVQFILFFCKTARAARNWINSAPQTEATTFAFSSVFILLLNCVYSAFAETQSLHYGYAMIYLCLFFLHEQCHPGNFPPKTYSLYNKWLVDSTKHNASLTFLSSMR